MRKYLKKLNSRFGFGKGSKHYEEALKALRMLVDAEGVDNARRAYAEAVHIQVAKEWAEWKRLSLNTSRKHSCIRILSGEKCTENSDCQTPASDHESHWQRDEKLAVIVTQPYALCTTDLRALVTAADHYDLEVTIRAAESFWYPGETLMVEIKNSENANN